MNPRIKELLAKALDNETIIASKSFGHWPLYDEDLEKFAELIVRECVGICECEWNGDADTFAASEAYNECADAIKEHFGVQE